MSCQVVRVEQFSKGSLRNIGRELDREQGIEHRNSDIDHTHTALNYSYKDADRNWSKTYNGILESTGATFTDKKGAVAFEGMIITSDTAFFESLGWEKGKPAPQAVMDFFNKAYEWAKGYIGYNGTDVNIISAKIHFDEKTPHLQLDYVPIVSEYNKKVYAKDENGKVLRNSNGSPIQAKDEKGKTIYERVTGEPKVSKSDFWRERGGKNSYSNMQDSFHEAVGKAYDLGRGEIGSTAKHKTNHQQRAKQLDNEISEKQDKALAYEQTPEKRFLESKKEYAERVEIGRQAIAVQQRNADLDKRENALNERENMLSAKQQVLNKKEKDISEMATAVNVKEQELKVMAVKLEKEAAISARTQAERIIRNKGYVRQGVTVSTEMSRTAGYRPFDEQHEQPNTNVTKPKGEKRYEDYDR